MGRFMVSAMMGVFLTGGWLSGNAANPNSAAIHALREQVKQLRHEEQVALKQMHAQYRDILKKLGHTEKELRSEEKALRNDEHEVVSALPTPAQRKLARAQFESLLKKLSAQAKLEREEIALLRNAWHAAHAALKADFRERIQALELQIKQLELVHHKQPSIKGIPTTSKKK
jgi:chromosome segregation ATPase